MAICAASKLIMGLIQLLPSSASSNSTAASNAQLWRKKKIIMNSKAWSVTVNCAAPLYLNTDAQQQTDDDEAPKEEEEGVGIMCEPCAGSGWLLCDFCKGQKTNVKAENNRIYRRCPNCRAVGYVLCSKCKVFKCVTYPDYSDGEL